MCYYFSMKVEIMCDNPDLYPVMKTPGSAGFDLQSNEDTILDADELKAIGTGLYFKIPEGYECQVRSRSGLSLEGIVVWNAPGTIDSDYRGEIKVILKNTSKNAFIISKGMRIAQAVFHKVEKPVFIDVEELEDSERGDSGFGSTGF